MVILTIETTCDETAAAVIAEGNLVLGAAVASQDELHLRYGGVVPEIASRAHVERILPVIDEALRKSGKKLSDLDAIAVANTPGLAGSLLVGLAAAKALCVALDLPLVAFNHLQAHVYACQFARRQSVFPCVGFVVSGGHTSLYHCANPLDFRMLGGTIDDAAGEAFDKVASLLGLGYPGGPAIERAARAGNPRAFAFPRAFMKDSQRLEFSFSGLKTAVRYQVVPPGRDAATVPQLEASRVADLCASFQEALVEVLVAKARQAVELVGCRTICVGGGVTANERFRDAMSDSCRAGGIELHLAPRELCTDNAVMGAIALERLRAGLVEPLDLDIIPGLVRGTNP